MADAVSDDLLRSGYDRWLRLEEAKAIVAEDLKELFAELKAGGFDGKALRAAFRHVSKLDDLANQEHEAVVDLYVASLTGARPAHAHEKNHNNLPSAVTVQPVVADAGEVAHPASPTIQSVAASGPTSAVTTPASDESVSREAADHALPAPISDRLPPGRIRLPTGEIRMEGCKRGVNCGSASATKQRCYTCEVAWAVEHQQRATA